MALETARIIVCETTNKWAVALRRQLRRDGDPPICETRGLEDCWGEAAASSASVAIFEITWTNLERIAATLPKYRAQLPRTRTMVVGQRCLSASEWLMRELGAAHAVFSRRDVRSLVTVIRRYFERVSVEQPSEANAPWQAMPWPKAGRGGAKESPVRQPAWLMVPSESD